MAVSDEVVLGDGALWVARWPLVECHEDVVLIHPPGDVGEGGPADRAIVIWNPSAKKGQEPVR